MERKIYICIVALLLSVFLQGGNVFAGEHKDASLYLMRMINDVRKMPQKGLQRIGMEKTAAQANMGISAWILDKGIAPLAWNDQLQASALGHAQDMVANLYYAYDSLDGNTVQSRIAASGYDYLFSGENLGIVSFDKYITPVKAAEIIFDNMLAYELGGAVASEHRNILNDARSEVGIAFVSAVTDLGLGIPVNFYLVVADFAMPASPRSFIVGNVSVKTADYPVYNIVNAISGIKLNLRGAAITTTEKISDVTGFFQFPMPSSLSFLDAWDDASGEFLGRKGIYGLNENMMVDIFIDK